MVVNGVYSSKTIFDQINEKPQKSMEKKAAKSNNCADEMCSRVSLKADPAVDQNSIAIRARIYAFCCLLIILCWPRTGIRSC